MDFYPYDICDASRSEISVWQIIKTALRNDPGVAFHRYQIFSKNGKLEREIDILIVHRYLGLWVIECKGCYIDNIESINGSEWRMKNWHKSAEKPVIQAQDQMFKIKNYLSEQLDFDSLLHFEFRVAIPFISREQWQLKGFHNRLNTRGVVLSRENLLPDMFRQNLTECAGNRQTNLTAEQWHLLMWVLGGTNQTSFIEPQTKLKLPARGSDINQTNKVQLINQASKVLLASIHQPELETVHQSDPDSDEEHDEFLENQSNEDDTKSIKVGKLQPLQAKKQFTEDSICLYLQEISRIRFLRADEEIELARKITDLLELERVRERLSEQLERTPSDSEWAEAVKSNERAFLYRLHLGRRAKDKMVQSNLRLVISIAKKYMNRGLSFQDLIQEGSLGLIRAAEKFDHEKGYKFSTYATWWIRQAITRAIADQSRTIRLPVHLYETISRIKKTTKLLSQEMGRKPTEEEIATRMEMTLEKLRFIARSAQLPISLEAPVFVEKDSWFDRGETQEYLCLGDLIEADEETPDEQVSNNLLYEEVEKILDSLSPRERDILRMRYGLDDGRMKTLEEISQIFNLTRERIRQIEAKALRKLRHPNRNSILKDYISGYQPHDWRQKKYQEQSKANQNDTEKTEDAISYFHKGIIYHSDGYALGAIENFTQALKLDPNNAQINYYRGRAKMTVEAYQEAIEDFTQAIRLNPQYIDAYYQRGHVLYSLGDSQEAMKNYSQVISLNPNEALAYFYLGFVRTTLGHMQGAISNYNQALKINPDLAEAYYHRGIILYRLGNIHRAVEDYNQALQIYCNFAEAYRDRGLARYTLGDYQGALEDYSQAVLINPEDALIYYYRAFIYQNLSDYIKALGDFNQVLEITPHFVEAYYHRGSVNYSLGNYQKALEDLDQLLRINSNNSQAYNKRSSVRAALKDYQGAMEDLYHAAQFQNGLVFLYEQMPQQRDIALPSYYTG